MQRLPPLTALRAFEAAARLGSVRAASAELCVTPGAVSRQIKFLEAELDVSLFRPSGRGVALTAVGEDYSAALTRSFSDLRDASAAASKRSGVRRLRLWSHTTFAVRWLVPRLAGFQSANPGVEISLVTGPHWSDLTGEEDASIRLGNGHWPGCRSERLVENEITPVCGPSLLGPGRHPPKALIGRRLLFTSARPDDWDRWLAEAGLPPFASFASRRFESSVLAYQASIAGEGFAIAQLALVTDDLSAGKLVRPFELSSNLGDTTYYLVSDERRANPRSVAELRLWLRPNAGAAAES